MRESMRNYKEMTKLYDEIRLKSNNDIKEWVIPRMSHEEMVHLRGWCNLTLSHYYAVLSELDKWIEEWSPKEELDIKVKEKL